MQQATAASGQPAGLDKYDPFNKQKTTTNSAATGGQPAVMSPTQEAAPAPAPPPAYTQSAQQTVTAADFQVDKIIHDFNTTVLITYTISHFLTNCNNVMINF